MPRYGTIPTQIRLTPEDKAKIAAIQERAGLPSLAAAIRHAVDRYAAYWSEMDEAAARNSRKKSQKRA